jgi:hypothetical protein
VEADSPPFWGTWSTSLRDEERFSHRTLRNGRTDLNETPLALPTSWLTTGIRSSTRQTEAETALAIAHTARMRTGVGTGSGTSGRTSVSSPFLRRAPESVEPGAGLTRLRDLASTMQGGSPTLARAEVIGEPGGDDLGTNAQHADVRRPETGLVAEAVLLAHSARLGRQN